MKKTVSAFALITAVALGTIGLTIGSASAHDASLKYDCFTVTATFTNFATNPPGTGANTATVTVNGAASNFSWTTKDFVATVPFTSHKRRPRTSSSRWRSTAWTATRDSTSQTFPADDLRSPGRHHRAADDADDHHPDERVAGRRHPHGAPPAAAAEAVVASPAFTG